jgi:hypothetical protein
MSARVLVWALAAVLAAVVCLLVWVAWPLGGQPLSRRVRDRLGRLALWYWRRWR